MLAAFLVPLCFFSSSQVHRELELEMVELDQRRQQEALARSPSQGITIGSREMDMSADPYTAVY